MVVLSRRRAWGACCVWSEAALARAAPLRSPWWAAGCWSEAGGRACPALLLVLYGARAGAGISGSLGFGLWRFNYELRK